MMIDLGDVVIQENRINFIRPLDKDSSLFEEGYRTELNIRIAEDSTEEIYTRMEYKVLVAALVAKIIFLVK